MMKSVMMTIVLTGLLAQTVSADPSCKSIHAVQRDVLVTENCPSPIGFCAAGTIAGNHGLRGTTFYSSRGFHPVPGEVPTRQVVVGTSTFTTDDGVIIVETCPSSTPHGARLPVSPPSPKAQAASPE